MARNNTRREPSQDQPSGASGAPTHPLLAPRILSALAILGLSGLGIALMLAQFIVLGWFLSVVGAAFTVSLYGRDLISRTAWRSIEVWIAALIIAIDVLVPIYLFANRPDPLANKRIASLGVV